MTRFRLLADDLTGALDSAARFAGRFGTVPVAWAEQPDAGVLALDSDSRDLPQAEAERRVAALAPALAGADLAFLKIDSLLRGHIAAELAVCMAAGQYNAVAIVPAFPAQGRITRHGRQLAHGSDVGVDLAGQLAARGVPVALRRPGDALPPGVSYWDAETDADLAEIATMARGRVLWCGTGGLAGALGGAIPTLSARLPRPAFALIGSNHPAAIAQLRACRSRLTLTGPDDPAVPADGAAIDVAVPAGFGHAAAADTIARSFAALTARIARPGTLIVGGGETLHGLCAALAATGLSVEGELAPGIPVSRLNGGRWDGVRVVSKSGAFGEPSFLARLLDGATS